MFIWTTAMSKWECRYISHLLRLVAIRSGRREQDIFNIVCKSVGDGVFRNRPAELGSGGETPIICRSVCTFAVCMVYLQ